MLLTTSGSYMGTKEALRALSPIVSGGKVISRMAVMNSPGMNDAKKHKIERKVTKESSKFAKAMKKPYSFRATFPNMLWFSVFNAMSNHHADEFSADFEYYKNREFFTDTKLNIYQKATINWFTKFFLFLIKRGLV